MSPPFHFCHACGTAYASPDRWPRDCASCGGVSYGNPAPVSVVLLPVDGGLLVVRRLAEPGAGQLALPGGYVDHAESWRTAGARELFEEAGIRIDGATLRLFRVESVVERNLVIIFSVAPSCSEADLPPFVPNPEASERRVLRVPQPLAFPSHSVVMQAWFDGALVS